MSAGPLHGLRVLVTRPAAQAAALCEMIRQAGGEPLALPLQAIVLCRSQELAQLLRAAGAADWGIFTSANAVRCGLALHPGPWPARLAAAGTATAHALHGAGFAEVLVPAQGDGSVGLLAEPALQQLGGRRVLLVTGASALPALAEGLRARGAGLAIAAVYRRTAEAVAPAQVAALLERADAAILSNGETLERLAELTPAAAREQLLGLQLAVPSARVAERARSLGFPRPALVPARVSDAGFLALLQDWCAGR